MILKIVPLTIKTIIFDFDGTLAKLNIDFQGMKRAVKDLICSYNISEDKLHTEFVLENIAEAFDILNKYSSKNANDFLRNAFSIIEEIEIEAANNAELFDCTKKLLTTLNLRKISCGIITRNCAKAVKIVFPDILSYCRVVVCRDDVNNVKPHPEHITLALRKLYALPQSTLMIGDHPIDIKTGHNAGTKTCGVLTGRCQELDFIEAGADIILSTAADILDIIT